LAYPVGIYVKRYLPGYLPLGVFTFLPTGLLPSLFRIFSKISYFGKYPGKNPGKVPGTVLTGYLP